MTLQYPLNMIMTLSSHHINGSTPDSGNSIAKKLKLLQSHTRPSICTSSCFIRFLSAPLAHLSIKRSDKQIGSAGKITYLPWRPLWRLGSVRSPSQPRKCRCPSAVLSGGKNRYRWLGWGASHTRKLLRADDGAMTMISRQAPQCLPWQDFGGHRIWNNKQFILVQ